MKKFLKAVLSFFNLKRRAKKDVIHIIIAYLKISCLIRCFPLRKYYAKYFLHLQSEPFDFTPFRKDLKLIRKVIQRLPGKHSCLKESLVVFLFFQRKGFQVPIYLGVSTKNEFLAHAWYEQDDSNGFEALERS